MRESANGTSTLTDQQMFELVESFPHAIRSAINENFSNRQAACRAIHAPFDARGTLSDLVGEVLRRRDLGDSWESILPRVAWEPAATFRGGELRRSYTAYDSPREWGSRGDRA